MNWISLNETRPEVANWVLGLCSKGGYWLCFRANGGWYVNTNYGQIYLQNNDPKNQIEIVYWMPIPELPKSLLANLFPEKYAREKNTNI